MHISQVSSASGQGGEPAWVELGELDAAARFFVFLILALILPVALVLLVALPRRPPARESQTPPLALHRRRNIVTSIAKSALLQPSDAQLHLAGATDPRFLTRPHVRRALVAGLCVSAPERQPRCGRSYGPIAALGMGTLLIVPGLYCQNWSPKFRLLSARQPIQGHEGSCPNNPNKSSPANRRTGTKAAASTISPAAVPTPRPNGARGDARS
jgi:hypothetical protein